MLAQQKELASHVITQEQIARLEKIGMIWNPREADWEMKYALAEEYYKEHGDLKIPQDHITPEGIKLGSWINNQRGAYKNYQSGEKKSKHVITQEQIARLESIGMIWDARTAVDKEKEKDKKYKEKEKELKKIKKDTAIKLEYAKDAVLNYREVYKNVNSKSINVRRI